MYILSGVVVGVSVVLFYFYFYFYLDSGCHFNKMFTFIIKDLN